MLGFYPPAAFLSRNLNGGVGGEKHMFRASGPVLADSLLLSSASVISPFHPLVRWPHTSQESEVQAPKYSETEYRTVVDPEIVQQYLMGRSARWEEPGPTLGPRWWGDPWCYHLIHPARGLARRGCSARVK